MGADGITIRGLVVNGGIANSIIVSGADHFRVEGNFLGSDVTGSRDRSLSLQPFGPGGRTTVGISRYQQLGRRNRRGDARGTQPHVRIGI